MFSRLLIIALGPLCLMVASGTAAADRLPGPVLADVVRVVDGDTIEVDATIWIGQRLRTMVRIAGIDTPELRGGCDTEKAEAVRARDAVDRALTGTSILLYDVEQGKFAGRVVARVHTTDGTDVGSALLEAGLARTYEGGTRQSWC